MRIIINWWVDAGLTTLWTTNFQQFNREKKKFLQCAATFGLWAPIVGCAVLTFSPIYFSTHLPQTHMAAIAHGAVQIGSLILGFLGVCSGLVALCGIRHHGVTGILGKALGGFFILILLAIPALANWHRSLVEMAWQPPAMLAQKIATADRVIISREQYQIIETNRVAKTREWREEMISKTGDEAKKIINAVSGARRDAGRYKCMYSDHLEFYGGTNLLATVRWQGDLFLTGDGQFRDNSGELNRLYHNLFMQ